MEIRMSLFCSTVSKDYGVINQIQYLGKSLAGEDLSNYHCVYEGNVGGMSTKLQAAKIANSNGVDMVIANSKDIKVIHRILSGQNIGTLCPC